MKNTLIVIVITLAIVVLGFIFKNEIAHVVQLGTKSLVNHEKIADIGTPLSREFMVIDDQEPTSLTKLVDKSVIVLPYKSNCKPCITSINAYRAQLEQAPDSMKKSLLVLTFEESLYDEISHFDRVNIVHAINDDHGLFNGWVSPAFYFFSDNKVLTEKVIGYSPETFIAMFQ